MFQLVRGLALKHDQPRYRSMQKEIGSLTRDLAVDASSWLYSRSMMQPKRLLIVASA
jgi:hypothetical protein